MEINVADVVLFTRSRANAVVNFTLEIPKTFKQTRKERNFQDVAKKVMNNKNLYYFAAHLAKYLYKSKSTTMSQNYVSRYTF